jgi:ABC-2 type transport system ATP-binding protein
VVLDADADDLRSSALTLTGPTAAVDQFARGGTVLVRESMPGSSRVVVQLPDRPRPVLPPGVSAEPTGLQRLVVALSERSGAPAAAFPASLEGASR